MIERSKPATREDTLAARLKSLRAQDGGSSPGPGQKALGTEKGAASVMPSLSLSSLSESRPTKAGDAASQEKPAELGDGDDAEFMFSTDDQTLEELLGDVGPGDIPVTEPSDEQVKALLEELSLSIPKDEADEEGKEKEAEDSDDSYGEHMQTKANDVIARLKDESELEAALGKLDDEADSTTQHQEEEQQDGGENSPANIDFVIPSLPQNLDNLSASSPRRVSTAADMDDITARMAALRAPNTDDSFSLPSVPSSKPSAGDKPVKRLTSKTDYTDDDIDSWCTVCLNDATLRCLGCDDDPYCTRCWREMHIGPAAAFDDGSHKAVQFTKARKKDQQRVALEA